MDKDFDKLADQIRKAKTIADLGDLKRLVGPSDAEKSKHKKNLDEIESIWEKFCDFEKMPKVTCDRYHKIQKIADNFENQYC